MSWIPGVVVFVVVAWFVASYNGLVRLRNQFRNAWHQIDVQLKRRYDLIPNLVETVKGAASFEKSTFTEVTEARAKASQITLSPQLLDDPARFDKQTVNVAGDVEEAAGVMGYGAYRVNDGTGTITFKLYSDAACTTQVFTYTTPGMPADGSYPSSDYTTTAAGSYYWIASYSGDGNNNSTATGCGMQDKRVLSAKRYSIDGGHLAISALDL